jgi:hypothetical protein
MLALGRDPSFVDTTIETDFTFAQVNSQFVSSVDDTISREHLEQRALAAEERAALLGEQLATLAAERAELQVALSGESARATQLLDRLTSIEAEIAIKAQQEAEQRALAAAQAERARLAQIKAAEEEARRQARIDTMGPRGRDF